MTEQERIQVQKVRLIRQILVAIFGAVFLIFATKELVVTLLSP